MAAISLEILSQKLHSGTEQSGEGPGLTDCDSR